MKTPRELVDTMDAENGGPWADVDYAEAGMREGKREGWREAIEAAADIVQEMENAAVDGGADPFACLAWAARDIRALLPEESK